MERFNRIGVFLNQEPGDQEAVGFAGLIAKAMGAEHLEFVVVRGLEDPVSPEPFDVNEVRNRIVQALPDAATRPVQVATASGLHEILRIARDSDLDLIVVGRRLPSDQLGVGSVFYRLARKAPCSVLVAPEHAHPHLNRLLVMTDCSAHSRLAIETSMLLARSCGGSKPQIVVHSSVHVGYGYRYAGRTLEQAVAEAEKRTSEQINRFVSDLDTSGVEFEIIVASSESASGAALALASARHMDAIVLGSRGMTMPAAVLLGSTAERVLAGSPLPVLIVKRKGETIRFLDALLSGEVEG